MNKKYITAQLTWINFYVNDSAYTMPTANPHKYCLQHFEVWFQPIYDLTHSRVGTACIGYTDMNFTCCQLNGPLSTKLDDRTLIKLQNVYPSNISCYHCSILAVPKPSLAWRISRFISGHTPVRNPTSASSKDAPSHSQTRQTVPNTKRHIMIK